MPQTPQRLLTSARLGRSGGPFLLLLALFVLASSGCRDGSTPASYAPQLGANHSGAREQVDWAESCGRQTGLAVRAEGGVDDVAIFSVLLEDADAPLASLLVEVSHSTVPGLANVGPWRVVPIGEFADWASEPAALRSAFDGFVTCVEAGISADVVGSRAGGSGGGGADSSRSGSGEPGSSHGAGGDGYSSTVQNAPPIPWRLWAGIVLSILVLSNRFARRHLADVGIAAAVGVGVFAFWQACVPFAFFHQNGQGPLWVEYALGGHSAYGPGYREVFGMAVYQADNPDIAVAIAQSVLLSLVPVSVYAVFRALGLSRLLALAGALACCLEPGLARLARGESYFGVYVGLLAVSVAVVVAASAAWIADERDAAHPRGRGLGRSLDGPLAVMLVGALAAGLFVAQAARVHPVGWPAAALVPLAMVAHRGAWWRRVCGAAVVGIVMGLVVLLTTLPSMLGVLSGGLGSQWVPAATANEELRRLPLVIAAAIAAFALGSGAEWLGRRGRPSARRLCDVAALAACVALVGSYFASVNLLGGLVAHVVRGNELMYAWVPVALIGGGLVRLMPGSRVAEALASVILVAAASSQLLPRWEPVMAQPTDAQEANLVMQWRTELPPGAIVYYVERAQRHIMRLPVYGVQVGARRHTLNPEGAFEPVISVGAGSFWYRSSICSATVAASFCDEVERAYEFVPLGEAELPARPSMSGNDYAIEPVRVGLYRVVGRRSPGMGSGGSPGAVE